MSVIVKRTLGVLVAGLAFVVMFLIAGPAVFTSLCYLNPKAACQAHPRFNETWFRTLCFVHRKAGCEPRSTEDPPRRPIMEVRARRYTALSPEEAARVARDALTTGKIPKRLSDAPWDFPPDGFYARGVQIDGNDVVVFAAAKQKGQHVFVLPPRGNLSDLVPEVVGLPKNPDAIPFVLNGVLWITTHIELVDAIVLEHSGQLDDHRWSKVKRTIPRGGYEWYIGPMGILLRQPEAKDIVVAFDQAVRELSSPDGPAASDHGGGAVAFEHAGEV